MKESIGPYISRQAIRLEKVGIDQAKAEMELILCHLLDFKRIDLYLDDGDSLTEALLTQIEKIIDRRLDRYPLQFILNASWFYGRTFYVNEHVMAPTPETELLCEQAISFINKNKISNPQVLDVGVGSGVISITLASELKTGQFLALDISEKALEVANKNIEHFKLNDIIETRLSDYFTALKPTEKFDLIVSNPPYIAEPDYADLDPEVKADPKIAMTSGVDGLNAIRVILRDAPNYLADGGRIMFEIGMGQAQDVADLTAHDDRYKSLMILKDLNERDRLVILECN